MVSYILVYSLSLSQLWLANDDVWYRYYDVRRNKFLFWAILFGFVTIFPTLYIPVINHVVFKHEGITWEWGVVFISAGLFFAGIEAWKWAKRVFFRRRAAKARAMAAGQNEMWDGSENEGSDAERGHAKE